MVPFGEKLVSGLLPKFQTAAVDDIYFDLKAKYIARHKSLPKTENHSWLQVWSGVSITDEISVLP